MYVASSEEPLVVPAMAVCGKTRLVELRTDGVQGCGGDILVPGGTYTAITTPPLASALTRYSSIRSLR